MRLANTHTQTFILGLLELKLTPTAWSDCSAMKYCILPVEHWAAEHRASASRKWCPSLIWTFPSSCPVQHFHLYSYKQSDLFTAFILSTGFNIFIGLVDAVLLGAADLIHHHIFINFTMHNQSWMIAQSIHRPITVFYSALCHHYQVCNAPFIILSIHIRN